MSPPPGPPTGPPRSDQHQDGSMAQVLIDVDRFPHLGGESAIVGLLLGNAARRLKQISQKAGCRNITVMGRGVKQKGNHPASDEPLQLELHGIENDRTPQIAYEMVHQIIEEEDRNRAAKGKGGRSHGGSGWKNTGGEWDNTTGGNSWQQQQQQKSGEASAEWEGGQVGNSSWGPHGRYKGGSWGKSGRGGLASGGNKSNWYGAAATGASSSSSSSSSSTGYTAGFHGGGDQQQQQPSTGSQQGKGKGSRGGKGYYDSRATQPVTGTVGSSSLPTAAAAAWQQRTHLREGLPPPPTAPNASMSPPNEPVGRNPSGPIPPTRPVSLEERLPDEVFEQAERSGKDQAIAYERRMEHWRDYAAKRRRLGGYNDGVTTSVGMVCSTEFPTPSSKTVSMVAQAMHVALVEAMKAQKTVSRDVSKKSEGIPLRAVEEAFYNKWNIPLSINMIGFDTILNFIKAFDQAFEIVEVLAYSGVKFVKPLDEPEFSYKDYVVLREVDPTSSAMSVDTADGDVPMPSVGVQNGEVGAGDEERSVAKPKQRAKRKGKESASKAQLTSLLQLVKTMQNQQINQAKILKQMESVAIAHENSSPQQTKGVASPLHQVIQVMSDTHRHQCEHLSRLFGLVEGQLAADTT
ncbi:hypothetical protein FOL47_007303 [Perkinsus chesapeaki]|uniref:Uncharacterized protein n=1 Tax=Perkinsus chesapeaki TaxID=330153 RepID=A0A7J6LM21_PERCH|nr:hypothetical protein FOL47_007303 [Perkinsus chesapeaki]